MKHDEVGILSAAKVRENPIAVIIDMRGNEGKDISLQHVHVAGDLGRGGVGDGDLENQRRVGVHRRRLEVRGRRVGADQGHRRPGGLGPVTGVRTGAALGGRHHAHRLGTFVDGERRRVHGQGRRRRAGSDEQRGGVLGGMAAPSVSVTSKA